MNYNKSTRKRVSRLIIDKANSLDGDVNNFVSRLSDTAESICDPTKEDFQERGMLIDFIDTYKDSFDELFYMDRYKYKDETTGAISFLDTKIIEVSKYIPYWNKFMNSDFCGDNMDIPMKIEDCKKLWDIFSEYYKGMPKDKVKPNDMWKVTPEEIIVRNQDDAVPTFPSPDSFKTCIEKSPDENENNMPISEISKELDNFYKTFFRNGKFVEHNYSPAKGFDFINNMKISRRSDKTIATLRNGNLKTYEHYYSTTTKEFERDDNTVPTEIISRFNEGEYILLKNGSSFAFAKLETKSTPSREEKIEIEIPGPEGGEPSYRYEYHYYYRAYLNFYTYRRIGNDELTIIEKPYKYFKEILMFYLKATLKCLKECQKAYNNYNENIKNEDGNPETNYKLLIGYIENYIAELSSIIVNENDSESIKNKNKLFIDRVINTVNKVICPWIEQRKKYVFNVIKDDDTPIGMNSILKNRMNKMDGTLFGWYAQECIPMVNEYTRLDEKIKNGIYIFTTKILTKPEAQLDYTQDDNGGKKLKNPNFIDVPEKIFKYYKDAGVNEDFNIGDEVYIIDDVNPEIKCTIKSKERWLATTGTYEDSNGGQQKKKEYVIRLGLDKSIPTDVMKYSSLRIVKRI